MNFYISDIVYCSFALIISFCSINQIYLLNRRFVYIRKFDLHAPQWGGGGHFSSSIQFWGFPSQGQTLYCVRVCVLFFGHGTCMFTNWNIEKSFPVSQWFFPCIPVWILNTGGFEKEKHLSCIILSWHQRSGQKSKKVSLWHISFSQGRFILKKKKGGMLFVSLSFINCWYNYFIHGINKMSQT